MARERQDKDRETRIENEIVVDAHDSGERALGWYYWVKKGYEF
jgi:hypothetical protein